VSVGTASQFFCVPIEICPITGQNLFILLQSIIESSILLSTDRISSSKRVRVMLVQGVPFLVLLGKMPWTVPICHWRRHFLGQFLADSVERHRHFLGQFLGHFLADSVELVSTLTMAPTLSCRSCRPEFRILRRLLPNTVLAWRAAFFISGFSFSRYNASLHI
jgi:hypothetical protein